MQEFGEKVSGAEYKELPCARGIVRNEQGQFAFVDVKGQYFLVGGGIEAGETPEQAVVREFREEIGAEISIGKKVGEAADYVFGRREQAYFRKVNTFFEVKIIGEIKGGTEADHRLVWETIEEVESKILQKSQIWAVKEILLS